jgi:uncharacterized membrane protein
VWPNGRSQPRNAPTATTTTKYSGEADQDPDDRATEVVTAPAGRRRARTRERTALPTFGRAAEDSWSSSWKVPHGATLHALRPLLPIGLTYVLSFVHLGIYGNAHHHHMLQVTDRVSGTILWANLQLLFWLSLIPVTTGWMGENGFTSLPTAAYGVVLLLSVIAYFLLQSAIVADQGAGSKVRVAVGRDWKGKVSPIAYVAAIGLAFVNRWMGLALYVVVALVWLVPDRRMERVLVRSPET